MTLRWPSMTDVEREREYSPGSRLQDGNYQPFVAKYRRASEEAWSRLGKRPGVSIHVVPYGDAASQTIDVAVPVADQPTPLLVFIHGGYWQELTSSDSLFPSQTCLEQGWGFAAIDYTLAPEASLDQIVDECCLAVSTLAGQAEALGFDASRLILTGSSAGAHLAAMVANNQNGIGADVAGLVLVSGIFELDPLIGTTVHNRLGLDREAARRNSPLKFKVPKFPSTLIAYGSDETSEFKAQSDAFANHLAAAGTAVSLLEIAGRNHFDVIFELAQPGTPLGDAVSQLIQSLHRANPDLQRRPEQRPCQH